MRVAARERRRHERSVCAAGSPSAANTASTWPSSTSATTRASSKPSSRARLTCVVSTSFGSRGTVTRRPEGTVNEKLDTGAVELTDCVVEVLASAEPPPFQLDDRVDIDESGPPALSLPRPASRAHAAQPATARGRQRARFDAPWTRRVSARSRRRCSGRRRRRARASSSCRRACSPASSTSCRRVPRSPSSS